MTVRFGNYRTMFYGKRHQPTFWAALTISQSVAVFLLSGTVLGLAGNFASLFLPNLHRTSVSHL